MTSRSLLMLSFLILVGTTAALAEATDVPAPAMYMPPAASVG